MFHLISLPSSTICRLADSRMSRWMPIADLVALWCARLAILTGRRVAALDQRSLPVSELQNLLRSQEGNRCRVRLCIEHCETDKARSEVAFCSQTGGLTS